MALQESCVDGIKAAPLPFPGRLFSPQNPGQRLTQLLSGVSRGRGACYVQRGCSPHAPCELLTTAGSKVAVNILKSQLSQQKGGRWQVFLLCVGK